MNTPKLRWILLFFVCCSLACFQQVPAPTPTVPPPTHTPAITPTTDAACDGQTASLTLSASDTSIAVGEEVVITVTLDNKSCMGLGLLLYLLEPVDAQSSVFEAGGFEPINHTSITAKAVHSVEFTLHAVQAGTVELKAGVSYEVFHGAGGPFSWGGTSTEESIAITVE